MKKVLSYVFLFIKHLFLRLRLVITLGIGRENEINEEDNTTGEDGDEKGDK